MSNASATSQQAADAILLELAVLTFDEGRYMDHGTFRPGDNAVSSVLEGFSVGVSAVFEAGALA